MQKYETCNNCIIVLHLVCLQWLMLSFYIRCAMCSIHSISILLFETNIFFALLFTLHFELIYSKALLQAITKLYRYMKWDPDKFSPHVISYKDILPHNLISSYMCYTEALAFWNLLICVHSIMGKRVGFRIHSWTNNWTYKDQ